MSGSVPQYWFPYWIQICIEKGIKFIDWNWTAEDYLRIIGDVTVIPIYRSFGRQNKTYALELLEVNKAIYHPILQDEILKGIHQK